MTTSYVDKTIETVQGEKKHKGFERFLCFFW